MHTLHTLTLEEAHLILDGIFTQHEGRFTVFVGGFPIFVDGECVGAVAAAGGNGEQDTAVCEAGIRAFMAHLGKS
jgi:uncharacterized protein GlcG (DUF336 family)